MNIQKLEKKAAEIRLHIFETALNAGMGHVPSALSWVEIAVTLYYGGILKFNHLNPMWENRDRFILSKGHGCLTLYAILADLGYFEKFELKGFDGDNNLLGGHPDIAIPGIETISGSLGHGLGISAGLSLGAKIDHHEWMVFTVLGDGECEEGSIWEAAMFASHHRLNNLVAIIDRNGISATGYTEDYITLEPFRLRWEAFGWDVAQINGHSFEQLLNLFSKVRQRSSSKPFVIIADTIKGKGVSYMENSPLWHHQIPKGEERELALSELRTFQEQMNEEAQ